MSPTSIVAYLVLFAAVGFLFLLVALMVGRLLRASVPTPEKLETYECGEPPVGSSFVQFDLRFYVVALVFLIFEVEVALFFPPATIFGKATQLMDHRVPAATAADLCDDLGMTREGASWGTQDMFPAPAEVAGDARALAIAAMADLGAFFAIVLLGFAYVWWRGDITWIRAIGTPQLRVQSSDTETPQ